MSAETDNVAKIDPVVQPLKDLQLEDFFVLEEEEQPTACNSPDTLQMEEFLELEEQTDDFELMEFSEVQEEDLEDFEVILGFDFVVEEKAAEPVDLWDMEPPNNFKVD